MKKVIEKIHNSSKLTKIVAVVLATAVCVTSVWHGWGKKSMEVNAETAVPESDKAYIEYIMDRMIGGLQENFTILEIVPHIGVSEFIYYADDPRVKNGLEANQAMLEKAFAGNTENDTWYRLSHAYSNLGYMIRRNSSDGKYEIKSPNLFLNRVLYEYKDFFEGRIKINVVEAWELDDEDINNADMVIFATGNHDNSSYAAYMMWSDTERTEPTNQGTAVEGNIYTGTVDKDGNGTDMEKVTQAGDITYNTFFKTDTGKYVSRDLRWDMAVKLCDMLKNGKEVTLSDGTKQTINVPFVTDIKTNNTSSEGNAYKFSKMYRMFTKEQYAIFKDYISTVDKNNNTYYNFEGIATPVVSDTKDFTSGLTLSWHNDTINETIWKVPGLGNPYYPDTSLQSVYLDYTGGHTNWLRNDYWVFPGTAAMIPANQATDVAGDNDEDGFKSRVGTTATAIDILRYLLGAKDTAPVMKLRNYDKLRILEIQPCVDFNYDTVDAVRALGKTLYLDIDGTLTYEDAEGNEHNYYTAVDENNYNDPDANTCISVQCMTSSAFNGINTDIMAEYDVIILGTNDGILLKDGVELKDGYTEISGKIYTGKEAQLPLVDYVKVVGDDIELKEGCYAKEWDGIYDQNGNRISNVAAYVKIKGSDITLNDGYTIIDGVVYKGTQEVTSAEYVNAGSTIYNDKSLNGYVYLAYGDIMKVKTGVSMQYSEDYNKYSSDEMSALEGNSDAKYQLETGTYNSTINGASETEPSLSYEYLKNAISNHRLNNGTYYTKIYEFNDATKKMFSPYLASKFSNGSYYLLKDIESQVKTLKNNGDYDSLFDDLAGVTRLSGNDISQIKYNALKEYVDSGKLVLLDEEIYDYDEADKILYPTSNMAKLAKYMEDTATVNKLQHEVINSSMLLHLKNNNPVITFSQKPTEIEYAEVNDNGDTYKMVSNENAYGVYLPFKFVISGKANTNYRVRVYVDKNNDGIFLKDENAMDDINERYVNQIVPTNAYGNVELSVTAQLSEKFNGLVAYKFEVVELDSAGSETAFREAVIGYTYVKSDEVQDVKVLQITPVRTSNNVIYTDDNDFTLDMSGNRDADDKGAGDYINDLIDKAERQIGYNIDIVTMDTYEFENMFKPTEQAGVRYDNSYDKSNPKKNDWLSNYHMVVIGFGDVYGGDDISNEYGALDCIMNFIDSGKAVLFTHDTIGYSPAANAYYVKDGKVQLYTDHQAVNSWSKELSSMFRARIGMDRYGITTEAFDGTYDGEHEIHGLQGLNDMFIYRHSIAGEVWLYSKGTYAEYTYSHNAVTNNNYLLFPYNSDIKFTGTLVNGNVKMSVDETAGDAYGSLRTTTKVKRLNKGQVTMFPYLIDEELSVVSTHAQWNQLDMEDEEIVVWYTLADDGTAGAQYYGDTDRDAGNNYYIYSKDNITYSGAGHTDMTNRGELRLFVNTIVKAIKAANNVPEITVLESSFTGDYYNIYVSPDSERFEFTFYGRDLDLLPNEGRFKTAKVALSNIKYVDRNKDGVINATDGVEVWDETLNDGAGGVRAARNDEIHAYIDVNGDGVLDENDDPIKDFGNTLTNETRTTITVTKGGDGPFDAYYNQIVELILAGTGATFAIELTDMYDEAGVANVRLVERQLFDLD